MNNAPKQVIRSQSQSVQAPARNLPRLGRHTSLGGRIVSTLPNPVSTIQEEELSFNGCDVQGEDSGSIYENITKHLVGSTRNLLNRESQMSGIKRALARASSLVPGNRQSLKISDKQALPGPEDFQGESWQGIEHYLRQRNRDTDPESLTEHKKPFYKRTWFACFIYANLLALLVAGILALGFTRSVVMPRMALKGEILPEYNTSLQLNQSPDQIISPIVPTRGDESSPMQLVSVANSPTTDESTVSPELQTTTPEVTVAIEQSTSSSKLADATGVSKSSALHSLLSLPGPLQKFSGSQASG